MSTKGTTPVIEGPSDGSSDRDGPQKLQFKISANELVNKDLIGTTDPYIKLYTRKSTVQKITTPGNWVLIGKSETIRNNKNPEFAFIFEDTLPVQEILRDTQFWKIEIWDHDHVGKDDFVADTIIPVNNYYKSQNALTFPLSTGGTVTLHQYIGVKGE